MCVCVCGVYVCVVCAHVERTRAPVAMISASVHLICSPEASVRLLAGTSTDVTLLLTLYVMPASRDQ